MNIVVDPEILDDLGRFVVDVNANVADRVQSLVTRVESVAATWEGASATSYHEVFERWMQGLATMRTGLESMRVAASLAAANHRSATEANVRMWR